MLTLSSIAADDAATSFFDAITSSREHSRGRHAHSCSAGASSPRSCRRVDVIRPYASRDIRANVGIASPRRFSPPAECHYFQLPPIACFQRQQRPGDIARHHGSAIFLLPLAAAMIDAPTASYRAEFLNEATTTTTMARLLLMPLYLSLRVRARQLSSSWSAAAADVAPLVSWRPAEMASWCHTSDGSYHQFLFVADAERAAESTPHCFTAPYYSGRHARASSGCCASRCLRRGVMRAASHMLFSATRTSRWILPLLA